jgi:hypothetical protein
MLKHMRETDSCGWGESMRKGVLEFPTGMNFWQRLKYLFRG